MDQAEAEAERAVEAARKAQIAAMGAEGRALSRWLGIKPSALASPSNLEKAFGFEPRPLSPRQKATRAEWKAAKEALAAANKALASAEENLRAVCAAKRTARIAALRAAGPIAVRALNLTPDKTGEQVVWSGFALVGEDGLLLLPTEAPSKANRWQVKVREEWNQARLMRVGDCFVPTALTWCD